MIALVTMAILYIIANPIIASLLLGICKNMTNIKLRYCILKRGVEGWLTADDVIARIERREDE